MQTFKVHLEQTRCAEVEIEADNEAEARHKALEEMDDHSWCEGHDTEITDVDRRLPDDED